MKIQVLIASIIFSLAGVLYAGDYIISIDGRSAEIDLNKKVKFKTASGKELTVILKQKEYLDFKSDLFSMKHKNTIKPDKSDLGDGIFQTMMTTSLGTAIIVQEYMSMNPEPIIDLMLKELTKEEVEYGYKYKERKVEKVVDGKNIRGKQALTTYSGGEWARSVMAYGGKDKGVLIITMIEKDQYKNEQYIIADFWKNLRISLD